MTRRLLVLAHRGSHLRFPQNSIAALDEAVRLGCDGAEIDVRLALDRTPVLLHDERLGGRRGPRLVDLPVARLPDHVPRLDAVVAWRRRHPRFWLMWEAKTVPAAQALLEQLSPASAFDIPTSFLPDALTHWRNERPKVGVGWIVDRALPSHVDRAHAMGATHFVLRARHATAELLRRAQELGIQAWTWGNRSPRRAQALAKHGLAGVIVDRPSRFLRGPRTPNL